MNPYLDQAGQIVATNAARKLRAPDFGAGKTWWNVSRPLTLEKDLRGKIVVLDFFTAGCINCQHVLTDLESLGERFAEEPVAIIGCHSGKYPNDAPPRAVREAILRHQISHPVVVDSEFEIWKTFEVQAWPTLLLIGPDGFALASLSGEGHRARLEALIEAALRHFRDKGVLDPRPLPVRLERNRVLPLELSFPAKIMIHPTRSALYIADTNHHRVLEIGVDGRFLRAFGDGEPGLEDGAAKEARFRRPHGIAVTERELFVADTDNHAIRRISLDDGRVETLAGTGTQAPGRPAKSAGVSAVAGLATLDPRSTPLNSPWQVEVAGSSLFIAMAGAHQIWRLDVEGGVLEPFAGDGSQAHRDGDAHVAAFAQPSGLALLGGKLYVADAESSSIRAVDVEAGSATRGRVTTVAGGSANPTDLFHHGDQDGIGLGRRFQHPLGLATDGAVLYVADAYNHKVKVVDPADGCVRSLAGIGRPGNEDGPNEDAQLSMPSGVAWRGGLLWIADSGNHRIRVIDSKLGAVTTLFVRDVPLPRPRIASRARTDEFSDSMPSIPGTVYRDKTRHRVMFGHVTLKVMLDLPAGAELAEDAPSQFRVTRNRGAIDVEQGKGKIRGRRVEVSIYIDGPGEVELLCVYYWCRGDSCQLRAVRTALELEVSPSGADSIVLHDAPE